MNQNLKKIIKILFFALIVFPLLSLSLLWVYLKHDLGAFFVSVETKYFYSKLSEASLNNKENISLADATNFEWDYVCLISPYGRNRKREWFEKIVGFKFDGKDIYHSEFESGWDKLLFISKKTKNSYLLKAYYLIDQNNPIKICHNNNNVGLFLEHKRKDDGFFDNRKGFYKINHLFTLKNFN